MISRHSILLGAVLVGALSCATLVPAPELPVVAPEAGERHFRNIRQLTNGGENAEAYFSANGQKLIFQSTRDGRSCDQQYVMNIDGTGLRRVSNGVGKTTCGFFYANDERILFGSSHALQDACPEKPDPSKGYVWRLDPFDIYTAKPDGSDPRRLTNYGVYTTEAVVSPDGKRIVFTSLKDGDLDIYTMNIDGTNVRRLTNSPEWDGLPNWSLDGKKIAFTSWRDGDASIYIMNADGTSARRLISSSSSSWMSSWSPDGNYLTFASWTTTDTSEIFVVDSDGNNLTQLTNLNAGSFIPQWSPDGNKIIFLSNDNRGNNQVNVMNRDGSEVKALTPGNPIHNAWSPDGQKIIFYTEDGIYIMNSDGSNIRLIRKVSFMC